MSSGWGAATYLAEAVERRVGEQRVREDEQDEEDEGEERKHPRN